MTYSSPSFGMFCAALLVELAVSACSTNDHTGLSSQDGGNGGGKPEAGACTVTVKPSSDDGSALQGALIDASSGDTVCIAKGNYTLSNQLSLATSAVTVRGDKDTVLDFSGQSAGANGFEITANDDVIDTLTIHDPKGDGIRATQVDGVTIRNVRVEWTGGPSSTNGGYGIYPVTSSRILVENCYVSGASDTGIYVGQSSKIVVRNNEATGNVAGFEIENSTDAELYGNHAHDNAGGILIFNLPGLNVKDGKRANVHDNLIENNNGVNFAPTGNIVHDVPPGTGMFVLAADGNELHGNTVKGNKSVGIAILSWYVALRDDEGHADKAYNWYPEGNYVHDNKMQDNGKTPTDRAALIAQLVGVSELPDVAWDGIVDWDSIYADGGVPDGGGPASAIPDGKRNCFSDDGSSFLDLDLEHNGKAKTSDRGAFDCTHPALPAIEL